MTDPDSEPLTDREQEIIRLVASGLSNREIANKLVLTVETVKWHLRNAYIKLDAKNRTQTVNEARNRGLLLLEKSASTHSLPRSSLPFVGRHHERTEIQAILRRPDCRILTLLGPGGVGKTRLAIEVGYDMIKYHKDGVWFIPLENLTNPAMIANTVARSLDFISAKDITQVQQLTGYLRERQLLLIIDNVEHLINDIIEFFVELSRIETIKIVVTSRERLPLQHGFLFQVGGLSIESSLEEYPLSDAEQLFLATAQRTKHDFEPNRKEQKAIRQICSLVEGMPLGIELAASWVRHMSCLTIAKEIERDLGVLAVEDRDRAERHTSIQSVIDHSWRLLSNEQQQIFAKLSVFSGGFSFVSARAVANTDLSTLRTLNDKSLFQAVSEHRYLLHPLLRRYGLDRLYADESEWLDAHILHCCDFADVIEHLSITEIERDLDNVQAAWRFAVENGRRKEITRFANFMLLFYLRQSWYLAGPDALSEYQRALAYFDPEMSFDIRTLIDIHESLGHLHYMRGEPIDSRKHLNMALEYLGNELPVRASRISSALADALMVTHKHEQAYDLYIASEKWLDSVAWRDSEWWDTWFHLQDRLASLYYWTNNIGALQEMLDRIGPFVEARGTFYRQARYLGMRALMAQRRDRYFFSAEALSAARNIVRIYESMDAPHLREVASAYFNLGYTSLSHDLFDEAQKHLSFARKLALQNQDRVMLSRCLTYLIVTYRRSKQIDLLIADLHEQIECSHNARMPHYVGVGHSNNAWLAWRDGNYTFAEHEINAALAVWQQHKESQIVLAVKWTGYLPKLAIDLHYDRLAEAVECARQILHPDQARVPDQLTRFLQEAITQETDPGQCRSALGYAVQTAIAQNYL